MHGEGPDRSTAADGTSLLLKRVRTLPSSSGDHWQEVAAACGSMTHGEWSYIGMVRATSSPTRLSRAGVDTGTVPVSR
jgi:hypothetical protein